MARKWRKSWIFFDSSNHLALIPPVIIIMTIVIITSNGWESQRLRCVWWTTAAISTVTSINVLDQNLSAKWKIISCNWVIVNCNKTPSPPWIDPLTCEWTFSRGRLRRRKRRMERWKIVQTKSFLLRHRSSLRPTIILSLLRYDKKTPEDGYLGQAGYPVGIPHLFIREPPHQVDMN